MKDKGGYRQHLKSYLIYINSQVSALEIDEIRHIFGIEAHKPASIRPPIVLVGHNIVGDMYI